MPFKGFERSIFTALFFIQLMDVGLTISGVYFKNPASMTVLEEKDKRISITVLKNNTDSSAYVQFKKGGSANETTNYICEDYELLFSPQDSSKDMYIRLLQDSEITGDLTIVLSFQPSVDRSVELGSPSSFTVTIVSTEATIGFNETRITVTEGVATSVFLVRKGYSGIAHSVKLSNPSNKIQFSPSSLATFNIGENSKEIGVTVTDNSASDGDRSDSINLALGPLKANLKLETGKTSLTLAVQDDDVLFKFSQDAYTVDEDAGYFSFDVTREGMMGKNFTIVVEPSDRTAKQNQDFVFQNTTLHFDGSTTLRTLNVTILDNENVTNQELEFSLLMKLTIDSPPFLRFINQANVIILPDDALYNFQSNVFIEEEGTTFNVDIKRTGKVNASRSIRIVSKDGTAKVGVDFVAVDTTLTFTGDGNKTIPITLLNNRIVDGSRNFTLEMIFNSAKDHGVNATIIIEDNEAIIAFENSSYSFLENELSTKVNLTRRKALNKVVQVDFNCDPGTASSSDYVCPTPVTFSANETFKSIHITLIDDIFVENKETFILSLQAKPSANVYFESPNATEISIGNDDAIIYFCSNQSIIVEENSGLAEVWICKMNATDVQHTVRINITAETAKTATDFSVASFSQTVVFHPGASRRSIEMALFDDVIGEQNETIGLTLVTNTGNIQKTIVVIVDDDNTFYLTSTGLKTVQENSGDVTVNIERTGKTWVSASVRMELVFSNYGGAILQDCTGSINRTLEFAPNEISRNVKVCTVVDDKLVESDETFTVKISGVGTSTVDSGKFKREIKVISDDVEISCQIVPTNEVNEVDRNVKIIMTRAGATSITSNKITCNTLDGSAKHTEDYAFVNSTITFERNDLKKNLSVLISNDNVVEPKQAFKINCTTNDDRVNIMPSCMPANLTLNILNDDIYVHCVNATIEVVEGTKSVSVMVKREGLLQYETQFWVTTVDGTAFDKADYLPRHQDKAAFAQDEVYTNINVTIVDDEYVENDETFNITIGAYTPRSNYPTLVVKKECSTVLIKDNDSKSESGITEKQAQELLKKNQVLTILMGVGIALLTGVVIVFVVGVCFFISQTKPKPK